MFNWVWCWNDNGAYTSSYMVANDYRNCGYCYWCYLACLLDEILH